MLMEQPVRDARDKDLFRCTCTARHLRLALFRPAQSGVSEPSNSCSGSRPAARIYPSGRHTTSGGCNPVRTLASPGAKCPIDAGPYRRWFADSPTVAL